MRSVPTLLDVTGHPIGLKILSGNIGSLDMKQGKEDLREIMKKIKYIFLQFPFYFWRSSLLHFCYTFLTDTRRLFKGYFWSHYISFFPGALARSMTLRNDYLYQMSSASQPLCPVEQALLLERRNLAGFVWGGSICFLVSP